MAEDNRYAEISDIASTYAGKITKGLPGVTIFTHVLNACQRTEIYTRGMMIDAFVKVLQGVAQEVTDGLITVRQRLCHHPMATALDQMERNRTCPRSRDAAPTNGAVGGPSRAPTNL
jgi:hypothetical protein